MKNQNKILMSLLTASISALAASPALAKTVVDGEIQVININSLSDASQELSAERLIVKNDIRSQVEAMLTKKAPIMKISESIDIVVDNYGRDSASIKKQVFEDLNLGNTSDSTNIVPGATVSTTGSAQSVCHATCHTACHGACHGARGWR
ncbi:hypothetical protein GW796_07105 [archaeon]|nr:hypothetical protein [archaeon]